MGWRLWPRRNLWILSRVLVVDYRRQKLWHKNCGKISWCSSISAGAWVGKRPWRSAPLLQQLNFLSINWRTFQLFTSWIGPPRWIHKWFRSKVIFLSSGLFYTSIFYRNECGGFHVRRAMVCGWLFYLGYIAISLRCSTERNLSGRLVSLAAWQFLLFHRFVPEWHCHSLNSLLLFQESTSVCTREDLSMADGFGFDFRRRKLHRS